MITRKTRRGFIALVVLTAISSWVNREQEHETPEAVADLDPKLNYVLRDFELQFYDESGQTTINMRAPVLRNNPKLQLGTIERPVIRLNQPGLAWDVTADTATITADKEHVYLAGQVKVLRRELVSGNQVELNTREVQVEVTPQTASTDQPVSLFDGINHMDAIGMDLNMKNDRFKLRQQVKASYAVN